MPVVDQHEEAALRIRQCGKRIRYCRIRLTGRRWRNRRRFRDH
ncbi:hypothetical protein [Nocardia blacklockiae]|nr:hypothetical protein [Nocardia blacklockiae]